MNVRLSEAKHLGLSFGCDQDNDQRFLDFARNDRG